MVRSVTVAQDRRYVPTPIQPDERDVVGVFILVVSEKWLFAERTTAATGPMESFSVDVWDWV